MQIYRLIKKKYKEKPFSGEGAKEHGGRWNRKGEPVVYFACTFALAALEKSVHLGPQARQIDFCYYVITLSEEASGKRLPPASLSEDWRNYPPPDSTRQIGSKWFQKGTETFLKVPSVVAPCEYNVVLRSRDISLTVEDYVFIEEIQGPVSFSFDARIWRKTPSS